MLYAIKVDNFKNLDIKNKRYHIFDSDDYTTQIITYDEVLELLNKKVFITYINPKDQENMAKYGVQALRKWRAKYNTDSRITSFYCQCEYGTIQVKVKGDWCMITVYAVSKMVHSLKTHVFYRHAFVDTLDTTVNDFAVKGDFIFADTDVHKPILYKKDANVLYNVTYPFVQKQMTNGFIKLNDTLYSVMVDKRTNVVMALDDDKRYIVENFRGDYETGIFLGDLTPLQTIDSQSVKILSVTFINKMREIVEKTSKEVTKVLKGRKLLSLKDKFILAYVNYIYKDYLHDMCMQMKTNIILKADKMGSIEIHIGCNSDAPLLATLSTE